VVLLTPSASSTPQRERWAAVTPAGSHAEFELIEAHSPVGYSNTPVFLKILLDSATRAGPVRPSKVTAGNAKMCGAET
jgi:hypothetical protein